MVFSSKTALFTCVLPDDRPYRHVFTEWTFTPPSTMRFHVGRDWQNRSITRHRRAYFAIVTRIIFATSNYAPQRPAAQSCVSSVLRAGIRRDFIAHNNNTADIGLGPAGSDLTVNEAVIIAAPGKLALNHSGLPVLLVRAALAAATGAARLFLPVSLSRFTPSRPVARQCDQLVKSLYRRHDIKRFTSTGC